MQMPVARQFRTAQIRVSLRAVNRLVSVFFAVLLCASAALAADQEGHQVTVTLQPANTSIRWTLSDPLHTVHGTFKLKQGVINFNLADGSADGLIEVDATSGESGNSARDGRMHKDVLETDRYPLVTFRPTRVIGRVPSSIDGQVVVEGVFRIHGTDHPLQLNINLHPEASTMTAKTHFVVPYVAWGMKNTSTFILRVGKTVDVEVQATVSESK
jgi:polyisoprenoid-binding protein YceI